MATRPSALLGQIFQTQLLPAACLCNPLEQPVTGARAMPEACHQSTREAERTKIPHQRR
jgi:hypothetical protein